MFGRKSRRLSMTPPGEIPRCCPSPLAPRPNKSRFMRAERCFASTAVHGRVESKELERIFGVRFRVLAGRRAFAQIIVLAFVNYGYSWADYRANQFGEIIRIADTVITRANAAIGIRTRFGNIFVATCLTCVTHLRYRSQLHSFAQFKRLCNSRSHALLQSNTRNFEAVFEVI
jgi:hypothetical protein